MLKENDPLLRRLLAFSDAILIVISFWVVLWMSPSFTDLPLNNFNAILLVLMLWLVTLHWLGAYQPFRVRSLADVLIDICKAGVIVPLIFGSLAFLFYHDYVNRIYVSISCLVAGVMLCLSRVVLVRMLGVIRKKGYNYHYVLVIGTGARACKFLETLEDHSEWGLRVAGLIDEAPQKVGHTIMGHRILGTLEEVPQILNWMVIDEVFFIVPHTWLGKIQETIVYCEQVGKRVSVAVDYFNMKFTRAKPVNMGDFPLLTFDSVSDRKGELILKRMLDVLVSGLALIVLSPLLLVIALLIKATSPGPVLFVQERCSRNGRKFQLYKFRTMVVDAEEKLASLKAQNEMKGPVFKMAQDPRVTPLGKWLRKLSLDELPQFLNVIRGDMSIVGPRPPIPAEVEQYVPWQRRRLSMRPGLSCLWQVNGRNQIQDFEEWMKLDLQYIDEWSIWLDLRICLKTVPVVLFGIGAK